LLACAHGVIEDEVIRASGGILLHVMRRARQGPLVQVSFGKLGGLLLTKHHAQSRWRRHST